MLEHQQLSDQSDEDDFCDIPEDIVNEDVNNSITDKMNEDNYSVG
jgi:hypothetical protein